MSVIFELLISFFLKKTLLNKIDYINKEYNFIILLDHYFK